MTTSTDPNAPLAQHDDPHGLSRYRKAIAAFITPLLGLPIAGWISGDVEFSHSVVAGAILAAITGLMTYFFPNAGQRPA